MFMQSPANQVAGNRFFDCILIALVAPNLIILQSDSSASRAAPVRSAASSLGRGLHFLFWSPLFCFKFWGRRGCHQSPGGPGAICSGFAPSADLSGLCQYADDPAGFDGTSLAVAHEIGRLQSIVAVDL